MAVEPTDDIGGCRDNAESVNGAWAFTAEPEMASLETNTLIGCRLTLGFTMNNKCLVTDLTY